MLNRSFLPERRHEGSSRQTGPFQRHPLRAAWGTHLGESQVSSWAPRGGQHSPRNWNPQEEPRGHTWRHLRRQGEHAKSISSEPRIHSSEFNLCSRAKTHLDHQAPKEKVRRERPSPGHRQARFWPQRPQLGIFKQRRQRLTQHTFKGMDKRDQRWAPGPRDPLESCPLASAWLQWARVSSPDKQGRRSDSHSLTLDKIVSHRGDLPPILISMCSS